MFGKTIRLNKAQMVGLGIVAVDAVFIGHAVTRPITTASPIFQTVMAVNLLFIGYGFGRSRDIQIKFFDERVFD